MKKFLTFLVAGLCLWASKTRADGFLGTYRNSTGTYLDSVYLEWHHLDSLALIVQDGDSIVYVRYRGKTLIDSTRVAFATDKWGSTGKFVRVFRASDGSGNPGTYRVDVSVWKNGTWPGTRGFFKTFYYQVLTDPPGDTDTSDVSLAATLTAAERDSLRTHYPNNEFNAIRNPGFENPNLGWRTSGGTTFGRKTYEATEFKNGLFYLGANGNASNPIALSDSVNLPVGTRLVFGGKLRTVDGAGDATTERLNIYLIRNPASPVLVDSITLAVGGGDGWVSDAKAVKIATAGIHALRVRLISSASNDSGLVDECFLRVEPPVFASDTTTQLLNEARIVSSESLAVITGEVRIVSSDTLAVITGEVRVNSIDTLARITNEVRVVSAETVTVVLNEVRVVSTDTLSQILNEARIVSSETLAVLTALPRHQRDSIAQIVAESLAFVNNIPGNLIRDGGFEEDTLGNGRAWRPGVGAAGAKQLIPKGSSVNGSGRWIAQINSANATIRSDSFNIGNKKTIVYGGRMVAGKVVAGTGITLRDGSGAVVSSANTGTAGDWATVFNAYRVEGTSGYHYIELTNTNTGAGDTMQFDNIFAFALNDTFSVSATASLDSSLLWRIHQAAWGRGAGQAGFDNTYNNGDSLTTAQRPVTASGGVTVSFHPGTGNRTVTITTVDSANGFPVVAGALVTLIDSTSHNVAGHLPSNVSGITTFTVNDGGYYIKTSKPGYRPIYGSSPSPQDSIYFRVSATTLVRTDTIEGVAQILPVVAGKCNLYGYVQDILGDSLIDGLEIQMEFANPPNKIECCTTDTTATVLIPKFVATTKANVNGRWEFNLYPSSSLIPTLQYKVSFKLNGNVVFTKILTVSGVSQRFNP